MLPLRTRRRFELLGNTPAYVWEKEHLPMGLRLYLHPRVQRIILLPPQSRDFSFIKPGSTFCQGAYSLTLSNGCILWACGPAGIALTENTEHLSWCPSQNEKRHALWVWPAYHPSKAATWAVSLPRMTRISHYPWLVKGSEFAPGKLERPAHLAVHERGETFVGII
jgi:hypothetical protein